jgi:hypothetical protein
MWEFYREEPFGFLLFLFAFLLAGWVLGGLPLRGG